MISIAEGGRWSAHTPALDRKDVAADEDVLLFDPSGPSWAVVYDGSAQDPDWASADLDAVFVPEPGVGLSLLVGTGLLLGSRTRRRG